MVSEHSTPAAELTNIAVLVVDDDESFRNWVSAFLEQQSYRVLQAADSASAQEILEHHPVAVLIADINMPGNDRLQFIRALADAPVHPPVILVTGSPSLDSAIQSFELPVIAYLTKPFKSSELLQHVRTSVLRYEVSQSISRSKERVVDWLSRLNTLEELLKIKPTAYASGVPIDVYITLTVHNIIEPLFDLKHLAEALRPGSGVDDQNVCNLFKCPRLDQQRSLLDHSVEILEKTKQSFKSKELGELRKKLEKFLQVSTE